MEKQNAYDNIKMVHDYLIENIVNNILFPNLAVYGFILLVINFIMIIFKHIQFINLGRYTLPSSNT